MAWIESMGGAMVNLDCIERMDIDRDYSGIKMEHGVALRAFGQLDINIAYMIAAIYKPAAINEKYEHEIAVLRELMKNIAGLARGNAVIMQTDVEQMMEDAREIARGNAYISQNDIRKMIEEA